MADRRGLEQVGGDLIEQRLEGVVVVRVHEHDVRVDASSACGPRRAGEPSAEDDHHRAPRVWCALHRIAAEEYGSGVARDIIHNGRSFGSACRAPSS